MKTYEPRRNNECPNGLHPAYNPDLDPSQNECTCPWLIIQSSSPVQHLTSWNRRETETIIREMDNGYFDPPGYPKRTGSMFLSPTMQRLLDVAEKEPVAAALSLLAGASAHGESGLPPFDAIAWDAETACLSLRVGNAGGWRLLWIGHSNAEAVTDHNGTAPGGPAPVLLWADHPDTVAETGLPEGLVATPHEVSPDVYTEDILNFDGQTVLKWSHSTMHVEDGVTDPDIEFMKSRTDEVIVYPIYDQAAAAVEALRRRVPQVPSDIAAASAVEDEWCGYHGAFYAPGTHTEQDCKADRDATAHDEVRRLSDADD